ncbi:hypothetical protein IMCC3317_45350 [Kordia antarctica]|uniref:2TM domain-containing protein n=1 Tax=Kordia antarctica TaxID=1218801 RepID=A0A7L4ZV26_9FLAO|nr:2TM domain-containing protein [Kordia antarctica]QHI39134.1 hypothetical protein IMCC3317_45350 [Kordia antarctica]
MELMEDARRNTDNIQIENEAYVRAKKKMESLRGFYTHLAVYILINSIFTIRTIYERVQDGFTIGNALSDGEIYTLWIIWGLGLTIHAVNVFTFISIFGQKWEERKMKEYMNKDTRNWK